MNIKHARNRILNDLGDAIAALRRALEVAELHELSEFYDLEEEIEKLIDVSNIAEMIE